MTLVKQPLHNPAHEDLQLAELEVKAFRAYAYPRDFTYDGNRQFETWYDLKQADQMNHVWIARHYTWAVPDDDAVYAVAQYGPFVESGAGAGYWAYMLSQLNCPVKAYDPYPVGAAANNYLLQDTPSWFPVAQQNSVQYLADLADPRNTLLLCWPRNNEPDAAEALTAYQGDRLVYIGHDPDGNTADDAFFQMLDDQWTLAAVYDHPAFCNWDSPDIVSRIRVYHRKRR